MAQDRLTFQRLAEERLAEARLLLAHELPSGAYYLAGYAIECALKAKIASDFRADEIPDLKRVRDIYVHDLGKLMSIANLRDQFEAAMKEDAGLREGWAVIEKWSEQSRYELWTSDVATAMIEAVGAENTGLLSWLQTRW
jgi:hypothetical protein